MAVFGAHGGAAGFGAVGVLGAVGRRVRWLTLFHIHQATWGAWLLGHWGNVVSLDAYYSHESIDPSPFNPTPLARKRS